MNRSRKQIKAAKARQEWRKIQEQKLTEELETINEEIRIEEEIQKTKSLRVTG